MATIRQAAQQLADRLNTHGIRAHVDPAAAETNRPGVLVAPPVLDYDAGTYAGPRATWRLIVLSSFPAATLAYLDEVAPLLQALEDVVDIDRAEPGNYQLTTPGDPVPCYVVTVTT